VFLNVKGIGKIKDSTIEMNGITVIAGENNTGKSTFGKALYCMFNVFYKVENNIYNEQYNDILRIFQNGLPRFRHLFIRHSIIDNILSGHDIKEAINEVIDLYLPSNSKIDDNILNTLSENIKKSISVDKHEIQKTIVTRCFRQEFSGKINHINKPDIQGIVSLEIKKSIVEVQIRSNECIYLDDKVGIIHNAIYIDTPFILDDVKNFYSEGFTGFFNMLKHRDDLLERLIKNDSDNTVLEEIIIKQKINNLLLSINSVVNGEFKEVDNNLMYAEQGLNKPIPLENVSAGIKMFLIIKRLLELGEIKEQDILIFDEPEIHLHPDWQIKFAEILILLQKEFNLSILLTTHSPYFLHAIEIYSEKHDVINKLKCYLTESTNDISEIQDVTENIDTIYKQLAKPFQKLEDIRYGN
jgi:predicted ATPase